MESQGALGQPAPWTPWKLPKLHSEPVRVAGFPSSKYFKCLGHCEDFGEPPAYPFSTRQNPSCLRVNLDWGEGMTDIGCRIPLSIRPSWVLCSVASRPHPFSTKALFTRGFSQCVARSRSGCEPREDSESKGSWELGSNYKDQQGQGILLSVFVHIRKSLWVGASIERRAQVQGKIGDNIEIRRNRQKTGLLEKDGRHISQGGSWFFDSDWKSVQGETGSSFNSESCWAWISLLEHMDGWEKMPHL